MLYCEYNGEGYYHHAMMLGIIKIAIIKITIAATTTKPEASSSRSLAPDHATGSSDGRWIQARYNIQVANGATPNHNNVEAQILSTKGRSDA